MAQRRILVVDGEHVARRAVSGALRNEGFRTREAADNRAAERELEHFRPDVVVLDAVLPDGDGLELARQVKESRARTPVIFLTARDATEDKVAGLAVGDDYVTKPFSPAEVVARVRAVLRRTGNGCDGVLRFADLVLDELRHEVRRAGVLVELTPREFDLLRLLLCNPRRVLTRREILDDVWGADVPGDPSVVATYVSYLRRKLDSFGPPLIRTVRFVGYALREPSP